MDCFSDSRIHSSITWHEARDRLIGRIMWSAILTNYRERVNPIEKKSILEDLDCNSREWHRECFTELNNTHLIAIKIATFRSTSLRTFLISTQRPSTTVKNRNNYFRDHLCHLLIRLSNKNSSPIVIKIVILCHFSNVTRWQKDEICILRKTGFMRLDNKRRETFTHKTLFLIQISGERTKTRQQNAFSFYSSFPKCITRLQTSLRVVHLLYKTWRRHFWDSLWTQWYFEDFDN